VRSKIRSLISIIRLAGLAVAALGMWVFATLAEGVLGKQSYAFDKDLTVN
jgi:undecaprenyl-diphosphatase